MQRLFLWPMCRYCMCTAGITITYTQHTCRILAHCSSLYSNRARFILTALWHPTKQCYADIVYTSLLFQNIPMLIYNPLFISIVWRQMFHSPIYRMDITYLVKMICASTEFVTYIWVHILCLRHRNINAWQQTLHNYVFVLTKINATLKSIAPWYWHNVEGWCPCLGEMLKARKIYGDIRHGVDIQCIIKRTHAVFIRVCCDLGRHYFTCISPFYMTMQLYVSLITRANWLNDSKLIDNTAASNECTTNPLA